MIAASIPLRDLLGVTLNFGEADVEIRLDHVRAAEFVLQQLQYAVKQYVDVGAHVTRQLVRRQQAVDQILQAISLGDDDLGVLHQLRFIQLAFEQLRSATNAAERVLDFVGQIAHQLAVGLILLGDLGLARDFQLLVDVAELDDQLRLVGRHAVEEAGSAVDQQARGAIRAGGLAGEVQFKFLLGVAGAMGEREFEGGRQAVSVAQDVTNTGTNQLPARLRKQVFSSGVGVDDPVVALEQQHRSGDEIESGRIRHGPVLARRGPACRSSAAALLQLEVRQFLLQRGDVALMMAHGLFDLLDAIDVLR